jgi:hypothetical protein
VHNILNSVSCLLTNGNKGILSYRELFNNPFWGNASFLKVSKHLPSRCFFRSVRRSDLDSMVDGMVSAHSTDVCGDLAVFNLLLIRRDGLRAALSTHLKNSNGHTDTLVIPYSSHSALSSNKSGADRIGVPFLGL